MPRSWTGEALIPVLESDPYEERIPYDPSTDQRWKKGDLDIEDIGANTKMPWEANGRRWHTEDRVGRDGRPIEWEGEILKRVVDTIQQNDGFAETNWNERSRVEITGTKKSQGWFFHGLTGDIWFLKMKFRVRPRTFKRDVLTEQIPLLRANDLENIPVYGNTPRVRIKNTTASWQEVEIVVNNLAEIDIPGFWQFLEDAVASFQNKIERKNLRSMTRRHGPNWEKSGT